MENKIKVKIKFLNPMWKNFDLSYSTDMAVGFDLRAAIEDKIVLMPNEKKFIKTGLAIEIVDRNIAGFIFSRSGLGTKEGLVVAQGVGVIDPDYRGEIIVCILNISNEKRIIVKGQRIAQLIFMPAYQAEFIPTTVLSPSKRGDGGFGHTGKI